MGNPRAGTGCATSPVERTGCGRIITHILEGHVQYRTLGRTGIRISQIGFGCGSQGGLMVRGERSEQLRAVARAVELGINYFDTAASYGDGESERNLGSVLRELQPDV